MGTVVAGAVVAVGAVVELETGCVDAVLGPTVVVVDAGPPPAP